MKQQKKNTELVKEIKNRQSTLKDEIKKMSEDEKEIEQPDKILNMKTTEFRVKNINTKPNAQQITNYFSSIKSRKQF